MNQMEPVAPRPQLSHDKHWWWTGLEWVASNEPHLAGTQIATPHVDSELATPHVDPQIVTSHIDHPLLKSEMVVTAAPLSFAGSAQRIWHMTWVGRLIGLFVTVPTALTLIAAVWAFVVCWYLVWGLWLVPYRLIRRGQRKEKRGKRQHRELLDAMQRRR
jgi:hypothetical protein